jgi:transposase
MPRKPKKTKGRKPRVNKSGRKDIPPETQAAVTALESGGASYTKIQKETGVKSSTAYDIVQRAKKRASQNQRRLLAPENFHNDRSNAGRRKALDNGQKAKIVQFVTESREHRNMQADDLRREPSLPNVSTSTIQNVLYDKGYCREKPGWKCPLDADNKAQHVAILKKYHPDNFDWHNVIFTDETPAKVSAQRGWHRSWAKPDERYHPDVKRDQLKTDSELMVWACFAYGVKGPMHVWYPEEEDEKKAAKSALDEENEVRKAAIALERMSRIQKNKKGKLVKKGRKPKDAYVYKRNSREGRSGIDSYRHREHVLKPLLIPIAYKLKKQGRNVSVLEDNAPAHRSNIDNHFFKMSDVVKLLWPPNSPDANAIEQAWPWLRRHITKDFPPSTTKEECEAQWRKEWEKLSIEQINAWIDEIPKRIIKILEQEGDNSFHG